MGSLRALLLVTVSALAVLAGITFLVIGAGSTPDAAGAPPGGRDLTAEAPDLRAPLDARREGESGDPQQGGAAEPAPVRVVCLSAVDRGPIAGVWMHVDSGPYAGPSSAEGLVMAPPGAPRTALVAWAPGWTPVRKPALLPLPEELLFTPADAELHVVVVSQDPGLRVLRGLLQPLDRPATGEDPWDPRLEVRGDRLLVAVELPPGGYDLYVWVVDETGDTKPLDATRLTIAPGQQLRLDLDGDAPAPPEEPDY